MATTRDPTQPAEPDGQTITQQRAGLERGEARARSARDPGVARARLIVDWLDHKFLDPIAGFVFPGVGDLVGSSLGLYIVAVAVQKGVPAIVLARMLINLAIDAAVGAIPVAGDAFDVVFKANARNLRLLEKRHAARRSTVGDWLVVGGAFAVFAAALLLPLLILYALVDAVF